MVNVEWCHYCDEPECRKAIKDCEHGREYLEREAAKEIKAEAAKADLARISEAPPAPPTGTSAPVWQGADTAPFDLVILIQMPNGAVYTAYRKSGDFTISFRCARTDDVIGVPALWQPVPKS